jgi:protein gp37
MKDTIWNPWKGCRKVSSGCANCYIHLGQKKRGENDLPIVLTKDFEKPIKKDKDGNYLVKSNNLIYTCFSSDFLLEDMDEFRPDIWKIMKERKDLNFLFLTKRINRLESVLPDDWDDGYDNVYIGVSIENQEMMKERIPVFKSLKIKHRIIACQPLIGEIDLSPYLDNQIEEVVVGGEAATYALARPLEYAWVIKIREACLRSGVSFSFRQVGSIYIKDEITYKIPWKRLSSRAREEHIDLLFE